MKKKVVIISTYPAEGSQNIGDQLITDSLSRVILRCCDAQITTVWRADKWSNVSQAILNADHVFFACLAIRPNMEHTVYPFLSNVLNSKVPFSVISAGTDLPVNGSGGIYSCFSKEDINLLREVNDRAFIFTTRGALTQGFCAHAGLDKASFAGDVAFYDERFDDRLFTIDREVKRIIISDPHAPSSYISAFEELHSSLVGLFPNASIIVAQHGVNRKINELCKLRGISVEEIYINKHKGLEIYEDADLHVGFRVHGHVSALKRRKYSYLLEQDGRGCDYGLTLNPKISIPNYRPKHPGFSLKNIGRYIIRRPLSRGGGFNSASSGNDCLIEERCS